MDAHGGGLSSTAGDVSRRSSSSAMHRAGLLDVVRDHTGQPVFVTGGPPRTPYSGAPPAGWGNPAYALHHAQSWDSLLTLGMMLPLESAAYPAERTTERLLSRQRESLADLVAGPLPVVAQIWGPLTMAATIAGTEAYLSALTDPVSAHRATAPGLDVSLALAETALDASPHVLWIAEPIAALADPASLGLHWIPAMRRLIALARTGGADTVVHVSGTATHALDAIRRIGVSGLSITAGTPLSTARDALGPHVALLGNLDSMRLLDRDEAWLASAARSMAEEMRGHPYVVTPGAALQREVSIERLAAFVDSARE